MIMIEMAPKYYIVKKKLLEIIEQEDYGDDGMMPSETELMNMFGISRITAKKAINDLVDEGYLYRIQGKGTFVKNDNIGQDLVRITSCTEDIVNLGMTPSKKLIKAEVITTDTARKRQLQLATGDKLLSLERVYFADKHPLNLTTTYLPLKLFPGIEKIDFGKESLYNILETKYDVRITRANRTIEAVLALDDVAKILEIKDGVPILLFRAVTQGMVNGKEVPIEVFKSYYRTDKLKFYINQVHESSINTKGLLKL